MSSASVTQLSQHRENRRHPDGQRLIELSQHFNRFVPELLDRFFSSADDFLFRQAEKNSLDATDYFEQLRVLRRRRGELRQRLLNDVDAWLKGGAQQVSENDLPESPADGANLSLMDDVSLERTLAVDSFANRTIERSGNEWLAFHERMLALTCEKTLRDNETPFNPAAFGALVFKQLEALDFPFKTTLMLFRLFDDLAISRLETFYHNSNGWLIEEGILPNLKLIQSRTSTTAEVNAETIAQLSATLAGRNQTPTTSVQAEHSPSGAGGPVISGSSESGRTNLASPSQGVLVDTAVWQQMQASMANIQTQAAPAPHQVDELKRWTSSQAQQISQQAQGTLESGTVSLVAMLFEYILDDPQLSAHMKQLLARLQIPIIKVAILDKTFFTDTAHSARLLLNRMARAASGWKPDADVDGDPLLQGMERMVSELNQDFEDDLSVFDRLLDEFAQLVESYELHQSELIDKVRSQEQQAYDDHQKQDRAQVYIETLLDHTLIPESVQTLLREDWYALMSGIFRRQGESKAWKTSARIAKELVWSLQPSVQATHQARFNQLVPKLLDGFAGGLKSAGLNAEQIDAALADIRNHHELYQGALSERIWEDQEQLAHFESQSQRADDIVDDAVPLPVDEPAVKHKNADLSYYLDQVESMTEGQWFDIELSDGSAERGQLSMIIGTGSKYVFTDYKGEKIAERSAIGLAMSLRNDQFMPLADDPLLDRMIDSLVEDLGTKSDH